MPAAGEAALERDKAWFRANPKRTRLTRPVHRDELPDGLRLFGIVEVRIERAGPSRFVRTFFNSGGRPVFAGIDMHNEPVVPDAPHNAITLHLGEGMIRSIVVDAGTAARDRQYFQDHPGQSSYTRLMTTEELLEVETPPGFVAASGMMRVTRKGKETRARKGFNIVIKRVETPQ